MFTEKKFVLQDFSDISKLIIKRSCRFSYAGKIPTNLAPRLVSCTNAKHLKTVAQCTGISGVIVPKNLEALVPNEVGYAICDDPVRALNEIQCRLSAHTSGQWLSFPSQIHATATVMHGAYIAPNDVVVGENVTVFPSSVILPRSIIGEGSTIGAGTIVGTDAFEVNSSTKPLKILAQSGGVKIGRYVDIQAKCTIVRSTFGGFTEIGDESKLDCQVHFAHDCRAGIGVRIAACAEISGRVTVGDNTFIGPNSSISNGITIGKNAHVTIGSVVIRDVEDEGQVTGNFAVPHRKWLKFMRSIK